MCTIITIIFEHTLSYNLCGGYPAAFDNNNCRHTGSLVLHLSLSLSLALSLHTPFAHIYIVCVEHARANTKCTTHKINSKTILNLRAFSATPSIVQHTFRSMQLFVRTAIFFLVCWFVRFFRFFFSCSFVDSIAKANIGARQNWHNWFVDGAYTILIFVIFSNTKSLFVWNSKLSTLIECIISWSFSGCNQFRSFSTENSSFLLAK